jgi:hypothetical protein
MPKVFRLLLGITLLGLTGCAPSSITPTITVHSTQIFTPEISLIPSRTQAAVAGEQVGDLLPSLTPANEGDNTTAGQATLEAETEAFKTPVPTLAPGDWKDLPVVPQVSPAILDIYQHALEMGNNPHSFSKIGDCGSTPAWFLGDFDLDPKYYRLGEHLYLDQVIQQFQGSFSRRSLGAKSGFNASSILSPIWADRTQCQANESPIACEYRVFQPVVAFIMLGSNDVYHPDEFEPAMREIIEYSIDHGVIPILATKADNTEGDDAINATIARLAYEYEVPLWNFWRAVQELPDQGLQEDGVHLTWGPNRFDDPKLMQLAWPVRNLTALQTLDAIWRVIQSNQQP